MKMKLASTTLFALLLAVSAWAQPAHTFNYANIIQHYNPPVDEETEIVAVSSYNDTVAYAINHRGTTLFPIRNTNFSTTLNAPATAMNATIFNGISPTANNSSSVINITSPGHVVVNDMKVKPGGQVVAVGSFDPAHTVTIPAQNISSTDIVFPAGNFTGDTDGFILLTDSYYQGQRAYAYRRTSTGAGYTSINPSHVAIDHDGNIIVVGSVRNGSYNLDLTNGGSVIVNPVNRSVFVAKYAPDMSFIGGGLIEGSTDQYPTGLVIDDNNNIYISGTVKEAWSTDFELSSGVQTFGDFDISPTYDGFLVKYTAGLGLDWVQIMGAGGSSFGNAVTYGNGKIHFGGAAFTRVRRQKHDELVPTEVYNSGGGSNNYGIGYVAAFDTAGTYESMFVMQLAAQGIYLIPENIKKHNNRVLVGFRVNSGASSSLIFKNHDGGNFTTLNSISMGQRAGFSALSIFIDEQSNGDFSSLRYIDRGTTSSQQFLDIAIDPLTESIHYVGTLTGNCDLNLDLGANDELMADTLALPHGISPNGTGFFIALSGYPTSTRNVAEASFDAQVYPSPTTDAITLELEDETTLRHIGVYDLTGRMVQSIEQPQRSRQHRISLSANAAGLYLIRATATDGTARTFKVVKQ